MILVVLRIRGLNPSYHAPCLAVGHFARQPVRGHIGAVGQLAPTEDTDINELLLTTRVLFSNDPDEIVGAVFSLMSVE